ncbi:hypothetical protein [Candidatus Ichthyocystis sparus]|uniref:hypothetical protein n=1 Tax=Candidatus Ichthyocystis sparus TaxID=1561004 RepID=UPI0011476A2F|nr:hypothetical protein [Candidatus Ichthyocystis sparus]
MKISRSSLALTAQSVTRRSALRKDEKRRLFYTSYGRKSMTDLLFSSILSDHEVIFKDLLEEEILEKEKSFSDFSFNISSCEDMFVRKTREVFLTEGLEWIFFPPSQKIFAHIRIFSGQDRFFFSQRSKFFCARQKFFATTDFFFSCRFFFHD